MENTIKFKRSNLANFSVIAKPGKYTLTSLTGVSEKNLVADEDGENPRYIVSLRAIAQDKLSQVKEVFKDAEEVSIEQTNGLFLTANIWKRNGEATRLPMKNEQVDCTVDFVQSREGEEVLRITGISIKPAEEARKLDLVKLFEAEMAAEETLTHS